MGGGFFDNMFDPFNGSFANPRAQPRPWYDRPESRNFTKAEEPMKKSSVRKINVTDGAAPFSKVPAKPASPAKPVEVVKPAKVEEVVKPVVRFESEDAAARKIQSVYRGYAVRKTQPLKDLRVIQIVKEEFEGLKAKVQEPEQRKKLWTESQERLRWTEGVMALLLRLDYMQGVLPEVRLIRKALTKELIQFQESIDSMSEEVHAQEEAILSEDTHVAIEEEQVFESVESNPENVSGLGQVFASNGATDVKATEDSHCYRDEHVKEELTNSDSTHSAHDQSGLEDDCMIEDDEPSASEAPSEAAMDVETKERESTTDKPEGDLATATSTHTESDNEVPSQLDDVPFERISPSDCVSEEDPSPSKDAEMCEQATEVQRGEEAESMVEEEAGTLPVRDSEKHASKGMDQSIVAGRNALPLEPWLEVSQTDTTSLSDRALLLAVLDENRKLQGVVAKLLQWGKHQNDVIQNLVGRVEQLEVPEQPPSKVLRGEEEDGRKKRLDRSRRSLIEYIQADDSESGDYF